MHIKFTKMHGIGNDFMVIDGVRQKIFLNKETIQRLAHRNFGVGFDQLLLIEPPYDPELDFHYRIFNADGSEVQMCGNGARCFARFVQEQGLTNKDTIRVSTMNGVLELKVNKDKTITVDMGEAQFEPCKVPALFAQREKKYTITLLDHKFECGIVSMGNPHVVLICESLSDELVSTFGPLLEQHELFPQRVNVGFMHVVNDHEIDLRVYERGCGETLACGSGACAAVAFASDIGLVSGTVLVHLKGGDLNICATNARVIMSGSATTVFEGSIEV